MLSFAAPSTSITQLICVRFTTTAHQEAVDWHGQSGSQERGAVPAEQSLDLKKSFEAGGDATQGIASKLCMAICAFRIYALPSLGGYD